MYSRNQSQRSIIVRVLVFIVIVGIPLTLFYFMNEYRGVGYSGWTYLDTMKDNEPLFALDRVCHLPIWYGTIFLFGVSTYILWFTNGLVHNIGAFMISSVKLLLTMMWLPVFFYWEDIQATFILTVVLWLSNGLTIVFYAGVLQVSGLLLIPEQIWISYLSLWCLFLWKGY